MNNKVLWGIGAFVAVILLAIFWYIGTYNSLIKINEEVNNKWAQVETQYQRRVDLIPNLVETVKGYASHEKDVFENVTKARSALMNAKDVGQVQEANNMLTGALKSLFAVAEAYPELRAQEGFLNLQKELSDTEDKIAYSRQFYNSVVREYNSTLVVFPNNLMANMMGFAAEKFFEAQESEKVPVKVDF